jgi:sugar lactone lactonase YvrE
LSRRGTAFRFAPDGSLVAHGDLNSVSKSAAGNELAANGRGNAYVNGGGLRPDGRVADGLAFPHGMLVTPDNATLIVAESYPKRLSAFHVAADGNLSRRQVWADLGDGVPDSGPPTGEVLTVN